MLKIFHFLTALILLSSLIDQLPLSDNASILLGIVTTLALIPYFFLGLKLAKQGKARLVIWSFLSATTMGFFALPFAIFGIVHAKREFSKGYSLASLPLVLFLLTVVIQLLSLYTIGYFIFQ